MNTVAMKNIKAYNGAQIGNPIKGAEIIYDVVTSSGVAAGHELPGFLPLGSDANAEITKNAQAVIDEVKKWASISEQTGLPKGQ